MTEPKAGSDRSAALSAALADPRTAWPHVELRDHQLEALDLLSGRVAAGVSRTWVDAPTGSGKTITFCALSAAIDGSALVLVPRRNLADQTAAAFARYFPEMRVSVDGIGAIGTRGVAICTYQAALRHADEMRWDSVDLLICDEAHTTLGAQTRRLLDRAENALIVGFTATPATTTGHVEQVFGPVAATLDRLSAINRGILCPLRSLRVERAVDLSDVARVRGDFDQASLGRALDKALWHRACADVWMEHFSDLGLAGVAYTATVAQAHALADELTERGVRAAAVSGQTPKRDLTKILQDFGSSKLDVLCNADLLTEGWDETRAAVVMHLAPTTSERVFVQRLGRVMRPAEGKEAVSVEFLPVGDLMGVQTSHQVFGLGWYKPLGRVAGPPEGGERGKLAQAAKLLAEQEGERAKLVNPGADYRDITSGLSTGGWRDADPGELPHGVMEEWIESASKEVEWREVADLIDAGISPEGALAWWGLTGVVSRRAAPGADQPLWRSWATALLVQPDLRQHLPTDAPRAVLDRLRMSSRERLRALWWHAAASGNWERLPQLEQLGRASDRRRRWSALEEASSWAPSWAWDVSRGLADVGRPGRNHELHRIASWEARHIITNGGEVGILGIWLRAAGGPAPTGVPPTEASSLRLAQAARLVLMLGPDDLPARAESMRRVVQAVVRCGGWGEMIGAVDAADFSSPDGRRALRAAVAAMFPKSLANRRSWMSLRQKLPRLPDWEAFTGATPEQPEGERSSQARRRRRRRLRSTQVLEGGAPTLTQDGAASGRAAVSDDSNIVPEPAQGGGAPATNGQENGNGNGATRRRRRRRRGPRNVEANANGHAPQQSANTNGAASSENGGGPPVAQPAQPAVSAGRAHGDGGDA